MDITKANGAILWQGKSRLDGSPLVAIVTGLTRPSANEKTGPMAQVFILRSDIAPLTAIATGADAGICGDCPHRGTSDGTRNTGRTCYVTVAQSPQSVFRAFERGSYPVRTAAAVGRQLEGRSIRLGAYGDPAAVPARIWRALVARAKSHTGYTHQWRAPMAAAYRPFLMASVDSAAEYATARAAGWRSFRVRAAAEGLDVNEIACPASEEMGYRTTCERCGLCAGAGRPAKSIAIVVHGSGVRNFVTLESLRKVG